MEVSSGDGAGDGERPQSPLGGGCESELADVVVSDADRHLPSMILEELAGSRDESFDAEDPGSLTAAVHVSHC